jgi:hypothetical protein
MTLVALALLLALGLAAQTPILQSVRIVPNEISLRGARGAQRVLVLGNYSDGLERDVTEASSFSIADPPLARVDASAQVISLAEGTTTLKAEIQAASDGASPGLGDGQGAAFPVRS